MSAVESHSPTFDLIDIGANLTHDSFQPDFAAVLERATRVGVRRLIVTGASRDGSQQALELARQAPGQLWSTAGIHPHHAVEYTATARAELERLAGHAAVVAVGECGLDYFRNFSPAAAQREAFAGQLDIAAAVGKPVFLHQRDAHADFLAILRPRLRDIVGGVAHCFTGGPEELHDYLDMGLYIGITGWVCDERRGQSLRAALPHLPLERLLLETDAPYLLPRDLPEKLPGRRNEPSVLPHVLQAVAKHMDRDPAVVAAAATRNTERLFALA
ncbi:MAG: TatD family hydrolase [Gammaproteobacteria bacterium]|jgi:TatD DNase family protein|nr:TatD family hydrolase [Gammaproteobacteria bacterium]